MLYFFILCFSNFPLTIKYMLILEIRKFKAKMKFISLSKDNHCTHFRTFLSMWIRIINSDFLWFYTACFFSLVCILCTFQFIIQSEKYGGEGRCRQRVPHLRLSMWVPYLHTRHAGNHLDSESQWESKKRSWIGKTKPYFLWNVIL